MTIVKIEKFENGAHANQTASGTIPVPPGWAVLPDSMETENFPFGDIAVEEIGGVMTVTSWTPGTIPDPEPEPEPEPTLEERVTSLENSIAEGLNLYEGDLGNG